MQLSGVGGMVVLRSVRLLSVRLLAALRWLLSGGQLKAAKLGVAMSLTEVRAAHIRKLEKAAEIEEERNKALEANLEFKVNEEVVLARIKVARSQRERLWERLGEYGTRRPRLLRWVLIGVAVLLILLLFSC